MKSSLLTVVCLVATSVVSHAAARQGTVTSTRLRVLTEDQEEILEHMSIIYLDDGQGGTVKTLRISDINVQIVNGLGATNGSPAQPNSIDPAVTETNGLGNLIVGYNEMGNLLDDDRTGSHNLVCGSANTFNSFSGIVAGIDNRITGAASAVTGGTQNWATGAHSSISGGRANAAAGDDSSVTGGSYNTAAGGMTWIGGGRLNYASQHHSSVSGGYRNTASGAFSSVSGGYDGQATSYSSSVSGGRSNVAAAAYSSVSGGRSNTASGGTSTVSGGRLNTATAAWSSISGGTARSVSGYYDWAAGTLFEED